MDCAAVVGEQWFEYELLDCLAVLRVNYAKRGDVEACDHDGMNEQKADGLPAGDINVLVGEANI